MGRQGDGACVPVEDGDGVCGGEGEVGCHIVVLQVVDCRLDEGVAAEADGCVEGFEGDACVGCAFPICPFGVAGERERVHIDVDVAAAPAESGAG